MVLTRNNQIEVSSVVCFIMVEAFLLTESTRFYLNKLPSILKAFAKYVYSRVY